MIRSFKISKDEYYYKEKNAEYIKVPIWEILLTIIIGFVPYLNFIYALLLIVFFIIFVSSEENIKFVPKRKLLKFLAKEV